LFHTPKENIVAATIVHFCIALIVIGYVQATVNFFFRTGFCVVVWISQIVRWYESWSPSAEREKDPSHPTGAIRLLFKGYNHCFSFGSLQTITVVLA